MTWKYDANLKGHLARTLRRYIWYFPVNSATVWNISQTLFTWTSTSRTHTGRPHTVCQSVHDIHTHTHTQLELGIWLCREYSISLGCRKACQSFKKLPELFDANSYSKRIQRRAEGKKMLGWTVISSSALLPSFLIIIISHLCPCSFQFYIVPCVCQ